MSRSDLRTRWNALRGDPYVLDARSRFLGKDQDLECEPQALVRYTGTHIEYASSVWVQPAFSERLARFEELVQQLSVEVYGRAPKSIRHFGAYSCRATRHRAGRISEHALGNAIDVSGFDFPPLAGAAQETTLPSALRRSLRVRVSRHWQAGADDGRGAGATHTRFLHQLAARLSARRDIFRVMIGPSREDHADHFHFDMSPWRYVQF